VTASARLKSLRIILALVTKDLFDLKNKNVVTVLICVFFLVGFYRLMPRLDDAGLTAIAVYDAGNSTLVAALQTDPTLEVHAYPSQEQLEVALAESNTPQLGLVIPADFDQIAASGEAQVQGHVAHWVSRSAAARLQQTAETRLSERTGAPVRIRMGDPIPAQPDSQGISFLASAGMVVAIIMIAKALTGVCYCLLGAGVSFLIYFTLITQWWLALLTTCCAALFAVSFGLLLGTLVETRQQLALWVSVLGFPMFIPLLLKWVSGLLSVRMVNVINWTPLPLAFDLYRVSFSNQGAWGLWVPRLAALLLWTMPLLALVTWRVRRMDRG